MDEKEEKEEKTIDAARQSLKGRAAWRERYKKANPEAGEDIDDEILFEYADSGYSDAESRYNQLNGANTRLSELVAADPRLGAVLSMVTGDDKKSLPYAMGSVFGKDWLDADPEEFEAGYRENLQRLADSEKLQAKAQKNIEKSVQNIDKYIAANKLSPRQADDLNESIIVFAENLLMGIVPDDLIELLHKGLNYDQDVRDAIDTGAVEAKNERIEPELRRLTAANDAVDMGGTTGSTKKPAKKKRSGSFYDGLKEDTV